MSLITLDFETYYTDKDLGFRTQTTEEYIRDPRFEVIGVSVQVNDGSPVWFSGERETTRKWLAQFNWKESLVLAHNTLFDGAILAWHFGIKPMALADTLCMARALHGVEVGGSLAKLATRYNVGVKGDEVVKAINKRRVDFTPEELALYGEYCVNDVDLTYKLFLLMRTCSVCRAVNATRTSNRVTRREEPSASRLDGATQVRDRRRGA